MKNPSRAETNELNEIAFVLRKEIAERLSIVSDEFKKFYQVKR